MSIAAALLIAASSAPVLGPIPRQELPAHGCAAFLWTVGAERQLIAAADGDDGVLRLTIDGVAARFARTGAAAAGAAGFGGTTGFAGAAGRVTLDLTIEDRADLTQGAVIPRGTLRLEAPGRDGVVVPVAGLIGCAQ